MVLGGSALSKLAVGRACPAAWRGAVCAAGLWLLVPHSSRPLPPAVLPCLCVCLSAGVKCALLLKHLVLDNLWIIANSR